jgi:hypothetical protein
VQKKLRKEKMYRIVQILSLFTLFIGVVKAQENKVSVIMGTGLYYSPQDHGDNINLIMGKALPKIKREIKS